jgi:hypothetical protein
MQNINFLHTATISRTNLTSMLVQRMSTFPVRDLPLVEL